MNLKMLKNKKGFTLVELLLVMVIISMFLYMGIGYVQQRALQLRIDRTSSQMQQILNAGLSYYVANGFWPSDVTCLLGNAAAPCAVTYLTMAPVNSWGNSYSIATSAGSPSLLYVYTDVTTENTTSGIATATAGVIAGRLPMGYATPNVGTPPTQVITAGVPQANGCIQSSTICTVVSSVNIPGYNLNNATAVNFAALYKHGGCVPVPECPVDKNGNTMTPEIMVVPASISGFNDPDFSTGGTARNVYPISSFTAYATSNVASGTPTNTSPPKCDKKTGAPAPQNIYPINSVDCAVQLTNGPVAKAYWRVCVQIITEKGDVSENTAAGSANWGQDVTLLAITRCAIANEPAGTTFKVYSN